MYPSGRWPRHPHHRDRPSSYEPTDDVGSIHPGKERTQPSDDLPVRFDTQTGSTTRPPYRPFDAPHDRSYMVSNQCHQGMLDFDYSCGLGRQAPTITTIPMQHYHSYPTLPLSSDLNCTRTTLRTRLFRARNMRQVLV